LRDAEDGAPATGALTYFYEPFLEAFDPELRKELGVWYTPPEIVRYQVHKVEQILREDLDCRHGFADERVVVLDPCCGTGAALHQLADAVDGETYGIELEGQRAEEAGEVLDHVLHHAGGLPLDIP